MKTNEAKNTETGINEVITDIRSLIALGWDKDAAIENVRKSTLGSKSWALVHLAVLVEAGQVEDLITSKCDCDANRENAKTSVKMGVKFARVDVGPSGKYMVDLASGEIFGIKAYGVVHRGHRFGTLETIREWDWSGYRARRACAKDSKKDSDSDYTLLLSA